MATIAKGQVRHGWAPKIRERVLASADAMEGVMSFIERRPAVFTGK